MKKVVLIFLIFLAQGAKAQLPVEVFGGTKKNMLDIMFFKYFKNKSGENSRFLFFNRTRASFGYQVADRPQFGFMEALSYNHPRLKGFAPVLVGQVFGSGFFPKAGVQLVHITSNMTLFSWAVSELARAPSLDYFLLLRYTPKVSETLRLYTQLESVNTFPTQAGEAIALTQRIRLWLKIREWQAGIGVDFSESGRESFVSNSNAGIFLRHEF